MPPDEYIITKSRNKQVFCLFFANKIKSVHKNNFASAQAPFIMYDIREAASRAHNGFDCNNDGKYKPITYDMYNLPIAGYIEK